MISLSVVILTIAIVLGGLWLVMKFNKGEELDKNYRDKYNKYHHKHQPKH